MTASISQQTMPVKDASAIRKRRRRAPAGGAADDCFTCTKRNVKCGRQRPYCSQCLEVSNECSGYKTQLTWGVGVASRGKLRGLSLPVVNAPPVSREPKTSPTTRPRTSSTNSSRSSQSSMTPPWSGQDEVQRMSRGPIDIPVMHHHHHRHHHEASHTSNPGTPYHAVHAYNYLSIPHQEHSPALHQNSRASMPYSTGMMHSPHAMPKYNTKDPLPIITDGLSSSIDSPGSEVDYASPINQPYSREDMPYIHPSPPILYDGYSTSTHTHSSPVPHSPPTGIMIDHSRAPLPCHGLIYAPSESSASLNSYVNAFESHIGHKMMRESEHLSEHHIMPLSAYHF
ncbi:hypothetical protein B0I35DRAFT_364667 [Stachybotrys elegans]|uniref:Zn(2)-C6 fungal-type domain-containing protein n=1 Tax=Stachybotrys elegans TaxID=80388 RepID=A0A8K0SB69_9HYPO|nr:hypothetical protein B0I35DRAFT_364667 [Stachybotrys elegans]